MATPATSIRKDFSYTSIPNVRSEPRSMTGIFDRFPAGVERILDNQIDRFRARLNFRPQYTTLANLHRLFKWELPNQSSLAQGQTRWVHFKKGKYRANDDDFELKNSVFVADKSAVIEMIISAKEALIAKSSAKKAAQGIKIIFPKASPRECIVKPIAKITIILDGENEKAAAINEVTLRLMFNGKPGVAQLEEWGLFQGKDKILNPGTPEEISVPCEKMLMIDELFDTDLSTEFTEFYDHLLADEENVVRLIHDIIRGMQTIHEAGIVHRDVKMSNVLLHKSVNGRTIRYSAKWTDLGLARPAKSSFDKAGTISSMAPEMLKRAFFDTSFPTLLETSLDVWPLGVMIYFLADKLIDDRIIPDFHRLQREIETLFADLLRFKIKKDEFIERIDDLMAYEQDYVKTWESFSLSQLKISKHHRHISKDKAEAVVNSDAALKTKLENIQSHLRNVLSNLDTVIKNLTTEKKECAAGLNCLSSKIQNFIIEINKQPDERKGSLNDMMKSLKEKLKAMNEQFLRLIDQEKRFLQEEAAKSQKCSMSYTRRFKTALDKWNEKLMDFLKYEWVSDKLIFGPLIKDMLKLFPDDRINLKDGLEIVKKYAAEKGYKLD